MFSPFLHSLPFSESFPHEATFLHAASPGTGGRHGAGPGAGADHPAPAARNRGADRKSTRLNSSHSQISYAVFCLKKKKKNYTHNILLFKTQNSAYSILVHIRRDS